MGEKLVKREYVYPATRKFLTRVNIDILNLNKYKPSSWSAAKFVES